MNHLPRKGYTDEYLEPRRKLSIPYFDGLGKTILRAWVQKLDTYFKLNPMKDLEALKYATLYLDGMVHEWRYHEMATMCHANILCRIHKKTNIGI